MIVKITFNELLAAIKETTSLPEISEKLQIGTKRVYGLLCVVGKSRKELYKLDDVKEKTMRQQFLNYNLFDYLLKKKI